MKRNVKEKRFYVPPTLEVRQMILEGNIALQSPVKSVELKPWAEESFDVTENNSDIWLNL